jgi:PAS domain S-box-containing protein
MFPRARGRTSNPIALLAFLALPLMGLIIDGYFGSSLVAAGKIPFWVTRLPGLIAAGWATGMVYWVQLRGEQVHDRHWLYICASLVLWTLGRLAWIGEALFAGSAPGAPGLDQLFDLAAYLAVITGILLNMPQRRPSSGLLGIGLDIAVSTLAISVLAGLVFLGPVLFANGQALAPRGYLSIAFPLMDLVAMIAAVHILLIAGEERSLAGLKWIGLGLAVFLARDVVQIWSLVNLQTTPTAFFSTADSIGFGFFFLAAILETGLAHGRTREPGSAAAGWAMLVQQAIPIAATILMVWYALMPWRDENAQTPLAILATGICVLLIVLRQGVRAGETEFLQVATLVDRVAEPAFICTASGKIQLSNPAFVASLGSNDPDAQQRSLAEILEDPSLSGEIIHRAAEGGWSGEVVVRRVDQSSFSAALSLRPMPRQANRRLLLAGTAHDLTDQKRQQAALQETMQQLEATKSQLESFNTTLEDRIAERTFSLIQAKVQLEQQNQTLQMLDELKSDFVSLVSHELRAPLTNISTGIELVLDQSARLPEHTVQSLCLVQAEIQRLGNFVETILDVSTLDAGHSPFFALPVALEPVMRGIQKQYGELPDGDRLVWTSSAELPYILGDDRALRSIFLHLIDNALKYAPEGEVTIEAQVSDARRVQVSVSDRGPGIPEQAIPLLFDKFYRLHQGDAQEVYGHGLGLYIVRRLLQAMGGEIRAENRTGGGACFIFWLNCIEESDGPEAFDR